MATTRLGSIMAITNALSRSRAQRAGSLSRVVWRSVCLAHRRLAVSLLCLLLGACAGYYYRHVPEVIRTPIPGSPTPAAVRAEPERFADNQVRWGGIVIDVKNGPEDTLVEVLANPLDAYGRPLATDGGNAAQSDGRFIARLPGFIDPTVIAAGKKITLVGTLDKVLTGTIG